MRQQTNRVSPNLPPLNWQAMPAAYLHGDAKRKSERRDGPLLKGNKHKSQNLHQTSEMLLFFTKKRPNKQVDLERSGLAAILRN